MTAILSTPSTVLPRARDYRPDVDGLRALAVTSVVLFHAGLPPFGSGFVGVDMFFVISGYLIGGIVLREAEAGAFSFVRFYGRRVRRILPALILVVIATAAVGALLLDANEYKDIGATGTLALLGASNINFWQFQDYFASDSRLRTLLMTWSLGVEEQFYLVFPAVVLATVRFAPKRVFAVLAALSVASFALSLRWTWSDPVSAFYLLPPRAWELGAGTLLAAAERGGPLQLPPRMRDATAALGLLAIILGACAFSETTPVPGVLALLPVVGTAVLLATPGSVIARGVLAQPPLRFVGLVSYSWYLWHWPMMSLLRIIVPRDLPPSVFGGVAVVSFGLAILSWRFVEQPFRRVRTAPSARTLVRYACALLVAIAVPVTIRRGAGLPARLSPAAQRVEEDATARRASHCLVSQGDELSRDPDCRVEPPGRAVVAVLGDSHAWALGPGVRRRAEADGLGIAIFARAACTPLAGISVRSPTFPDLFTACTTFKAAALDAIARDPAIGTVMVVGYWWGPLSLTPPFGYAAADGSADHDGPTLLRRGLDGMVERLQAAGKTVVLFQDVPDWGFDPLKIALANSMPARGAVARLFDPDVTAMADGHMPAARLKRHPEIAALVDAVAAAHPGTRVIDPVPTFCTATTCTFARDGQPLFFDKDHLSERGAAAVLAGVPLLAR